LSGRTQYSREQYNLRNKFAQEGTKNITVSDKSTNLDTCTEISNKDAKKFVSKYIKVHNNGDISEILGLYYTSEIVDLYDYDGNYNLEKIRTKDLTRHLEVKTIYHERMPVLKYELLDDKNTIEDLPDEDIKVVAFTTFVTAYNPEKERGLTVEALTIIKLCLINGDLKIVDEKQKVLSQKEY